MHCQHMKAFNIFSNHNESRNHAFYISKNHVKSIICQHIPNHKSIIDSLKTLHNPNIHRQNNPNIHRQNIRVHP